MCKAFPPILHPVLPLLWHKGSREKGKKWHIPAVRQWCRKFGQDYANRLRCRRPQPGDKWHLDEVFLTINGERYYLWRAMDQDNNVLDILV